jgi:hypothetical protein
MTLRKIGGTGTPPGGPAQSGQLAANVALSDTGLYFTHANLTKTINTSFSYLVAACLIVRDTAGGANFYGRITDGVTVFAASAVFTPGASVNGLLSLVARIPSGHAGSVWAEVRDLSSVSGLILSDEVAAGKASTIIVWPN